MIVLTRAKFLLLILLLLALLSGGLLAGIAYRDPIVSWLGGQTAPETAAHDPVSHTPGEREVLYWYDPMHPAYKSDQPGIAPDCGMQLVPKYADEVEAMQERPPGTVMLSPQKQQLIGVRTTQVQRQRLERTIRTVGHLEVDETQIARIHVKIAGWVEQVYVDFVGKRVQKGQPLFTLYSPELVSTQQEYLIARRGVEDLGNSPYQDVARGAESLLRASRQRLQLWDISEEQIERLEKTGEVKRTMTLYSPIDGFVLHRNLYARVYVTPDMQLYEIADLSTIWVYVDVYEYEIPYVRLGQAATMRLSYFPGQPYRGRVTYIYPTLDPRTRTVKVRLEFPNPNFEFKPGMFADIELKIDYGVQTLVPSEAVLDSGLRQIVFVAKPGGFFEPREVQLGARLENQYIVLEGLKPGETVVTSGNFLIDSESRLSSATGGMSYQH
ncbi:MAG: efflux RND transporter periplasmic adaptor subunit [Candidatus Acidoferrales bacterium]